MLITLPISKSIAQRQLMIRAMRGEDLSRLPLLWGNENEWPDDVKTMYGGLLACSGQIDVNNDGTAMRFLTAYYAQKPGVDITIDGCERMRQRPMRQLVDALRELGADITYLNTEGFAPLHIRGRHLSTDTVVLNNPLSTQFISALLLIGADVQTNCQSPYIDMTRQMIASPLPDVVEADWSAAAFWLEREALGLGVYHFLSLNSSSIQGDKIAVELFKQIKERTITSWDFSSCPDLFPAAAVACYLLDLHPDFVGLESLRWKESDRITAIHEAFETIDTAKITHSKPIICAHSDHRIAMAFLAAGFQVDNPLCVTKSYPSFLTQLQKAEMEDCQHSKDLLLPNYIQRIIPRRGVNDDHRGKKWALHCLVPAASTEYVWLTDDDIVFPQSCPSQSELDDADMLILPLRMEGDNTFLGRLQKLEYTAIQELTMRKAKAGKPVMCSGANLIVRKHAWIECEPDIHPEIPSGDDMFMLEAMKKRGLRVVPLDAPQYEAICKASPDIKTLFRQRMRWAGKAPHYFDSDILRCMVTTSFSNLLVLICPLWFMIKWLYDMHQITPRLRRYGLYHGLSSPIDYLMAWLDGLLLTILYPWYMLICLLGGLTHQKRW